MKKGKAVYIEWIDSAVTDPTWMSAEEAIEWGKNNENNKIKQIGFVLKKTKHTLILISRYSPDQVAGVFKIPLKCITKTSFLSV